MEEKKIKLILDAQPLCQEKLTGIGRVTQELIKGLCESGQYDITLQATSKNKKAYEFLLANVPFISSSRVRFYRIPTKILYMLYLVVPHLHERLFGKADMFLAFNFMLPIGLREKSALFVHDMVVKRYPETMARSVRVALHLFLHTSCNRADIILTNSNFSLQEICECMRVLPEKVQILPLAFDQKVFHVQDNASVIQQACHRYGVDAPYFLYVGTLEPRKNIVRLVDAYASLYQTVKDGTFLPKLVLAGKKGWLYDEIFAHVKANHLEEAVIFTGYVPDEDLSLLMNGARAFVFPSLYEGFGLPPLEAMACGAPVLCSSAASLPEVVGDAAIVVNPLSVEEIAAGLNRLAFDDALCAQLRSKGLARAQQFSWESSVNLLISAVNQLLE